MNFHEKEAVTTISYEYFMKIHEKEAEIVYFGHFIFFFDRQNVKDIEYKKIFKKMIYQLNDNSHWHRRGFCGKFIKKCFFFTDIDIDIDIDIDTDIDNDT